MYFLIFLAWLHFIFAVLFLIHIMNNWVIT